MEEANPGEGAHISLKAHPAPSPSPLRAFATDEEDDGGHLLELSSDECDKMNFKILAAAASTDRKSFFIPRVQPLGLLFFRHIFTRLRQQQAVIQAASRGSVSEPKDGDDETIPIAAFQRAMGRLFYMLRDPVGFDATIYDQNGDNSVGWSEFTQVWKDRQITVRHNLAERIFLTVDDPQSSSMAKIFAVLTLTTIVVSSLCFILSTVPELQQDPGDGSAPKPGPIFELIEHICLFIFVVEYFTRLCTSWSVRPEICDKGVLSDLVVGYERIDLSTSSKSLIRFLLSPSNLIDLAAILPGIVTVLMWMVTQEPAGNGGGFVVLRLIRLTRIFRAFRLGKYVEPMIIINRTVKQSTKALYVLAFNLALGVVIFGSLMFLMEQGTWNVQARRFDRYVDRHWNATVNDFVEEYGPSPWKSIPQCFWWALVTAAGVGYGDNYPTTANGYLVATICMVWSLVILALPVGVIGGTFMQVWNDFAKNKLIVAEALRQEMMHVASAVQNLEPATVSRLVLLEVWADDGCEASMPKNPEGFMGEAKLELELSQDSSVSRDLRVPLKSNGLVCNREVSGEISVRYDWTPAPPTAEDDSNPRSQLLLRGTLQFYVVGATNLLNTDWGHPDGISSPYVLMLCYPTSPAPGDELKPVVWRSRVTRCSLNPRWECGESLSYLWYSHRDAQEKVTRSSSRRFLTACPSGSSLSPKSQPSPTKSRVVMRNNARMVSALSQLTANIPHVAAGIEKLQDEMQNLTRRVDQLQFSAANYFDDAPERRLCNQDGESDQRSTSKSDTNLYQRKVP
jgi:hypothetical protein